MSLAIKEEKVKKVLLADGWHRVVESTFILDAYEFMDGEEMSHGGGNSGVCATGFRFTSYDFVKNEKDPEGHDVLIVLSGPLTSIIAIQEDRIG